MEKIGYLYKGLRDEEIVMRRLIPKQQGPFKQYPKLPLKIPFEVDVTRDNAAQNHQKEKGESKYLTSGVSTSTRRDVAVHYATHGHTKHGFVAHIRRDALAAFGIEEFDVARCPEVLHPKDAEIILYDDIGLAMPPQIIERFEEVDPPVQQSASPDRSAGAPAGAPN